MRLPEQLNIEDTLQNNEIKQLRMYEMSMPYRERSVTTTHSRGITVKDLLQSMVELKPRRSIGLQSEFPIKKIIVNIFPPTLDMCIYY